MRSPNPLKRIAYIVSTLSQTGPTNQLYNTIKYLDKSYWDITIITLSPEPENSLSHKFEKLGVNIVTLGLNRIQGLFFLKNKLISAISKINPDIIHTQGFRADTLVAKAGFYCHWTSTSRNMPYEDYPLKFGKIRGSLMAHIHVRALKSCEHVISCSSSIHDKLKSIGVNSKIIRNGVDKISAVGKDPNIFEKLGHPIFITVGSLITRKNIEMLVRAFENGEKRLGTLLVVGDGPELNFLESISSESIVFIGQVDNVGDYLSFSDFFISASLSEGMPNAALEALSCGLPCFLSKIPAHEELREIAPEPVSLFDLDLSPAELQNFLILQSKKFPNNVKLIASNYAENILSARACALNYHFHYFDILENKYE